MGNWKAWLWTGLGSFAGGAGGWVTTRIEDGALPSTATQWKAVGIGALVAGVVGFANWLRKSPIGGES